MSEFWQGAIAGVLIFILVVVFVVTVLVVEYDWVERREEQAIKDYKSGKRKAKP